ncbi:MAG: hypothetical protein R2710_04375 [Acidimicrobiales bacterium]
MVHPRRRRHRLHPTLAGRLSRQHSPRSPGRALDRRGRAPYRKLTVQGDARIVHEAGEDDEWRDLYRSIAKRYVGEESADAYVDNTIDQPRALIAVSLANSTTSTWRMPVEGESGTGIWARRYYGDGTTMAKRRWSRLIAQARSPMVRLDPHRVTDP